MKKFLALAMAAVLALAGTTAFAAADQAASEPDAASSQSEPERPENATRILELMNEEREKAKLEPFVEDAALDAVAMLRAEECKVICDPNHTRPNGTSYVTAFDEAKIPYVYWGEISFDGGKSIDTPEKAVKGWFDSAPHKEIILSKNLTTVGIGRYVDDGTYYWVVDFTGGK